MLAAIHVLKACRWKFKLLLLCGFTDKKYKNLQVKLQDLLKPTVIKPWWNAQICWSVIVLNITIIHHTVCFMQKLSLVIIRRLRRFFLLIFSFVYFFCTTMHFSLNLLENMNTSMCLDCEKCLCMCCECSIIYFLYCIYTAFLGQMSIETCTF